MTIPLLLFLVFLLLIFVAACVIGFITSDPDRNGLGPSIAGGLLVCVVLFAIFRWGHAAGVAHAERRFITVNPPQEVKETK